MLDNTLRQWAAVLGKMCCMVFLPWTEHITALLPVLMAKPTVQSFIYPRENENAPGSEAAFQLARASCQGFFG